MMRTVWLAVLAVTLAAARPGQAQEREVLRAQLDRAIAVLDSAQIERAVTLLRSLTTAFGPTAPVDLRVTTHLLLGEAYWSLGFADSAEIQFTAAVRSSPFVRVHPDFFNPDVMEAFRLAKRTTVALGFRTPRDTVIDPVAERWPIAFAVGRPGDVHVQLSGPGLPAGGMLVVSLEVDSLEEHSVSLLVSDSIAFEPGSYALRAVLSTTGGSDTAHVDFSVERQPVDTAAHDPPLDPSRFRAEIRKGSPPLSSILRGALVGAAAAAIPVIITSKDLGNDNLELRAVAVGATITVAGLAGLVLGRPEVPIEQNIVYNRDIRSGWERRNQMIARDNAMKIRLAPLRLRVIKSP